ncbi:MAG TPA: helix-turn-helix domain-containing protein [Candidatus Saccharimonadales bacterium]|nr:helix-turn-helix domain-containing protein [Candidatus Saccharimonadales bacterium]
MYAPVLESTYPITFQEKDAQKLGDYLRQRQSVNLVGMKRVGISNFLRFFLRHDDIIPTYISDKNDHLFIPVDLNDLVEQEIYPFWTLTLKRVLDATEQSHLPPAVKEKISELFDKSIQFQDLFLVIDNIRQALTLLVSNGVYPTIFFLRFDRLKDTFNPSLFDNFEGLREASHSNVSFVFTSDRSLGSAFPEARSSLSLFAQTMFFKPATKEDMKIVYNAYSQRYNLSLPEDVEKTLFTIIGGYMQYLQLGLIRLDELKMDSPKTSKAMLGTLLEDERISLQSEELWESLTVDEKRVLMQIINGQRVEASAYEKTKYLWDTGFVNEEKGKPIIFSPLFGAYVQQIEHEEKKKRKSAHLTRKENSLFLLLKSQLGEICERDKIIEVVWPESQEFGVSDWAIDRLVARVRVKLREQDNPYEIQTIRTRGYKLTPLKE